MERETQRKIDNFLTNTWGPAIDSGLEPMEMGSTTVIEIMRATKTPSAERVIRNLPNTISPNGQEFRVKISKPNNPQIKKNRRRATKVPPVKGRWCDRKRLDERRLKHLTKISEKERSRILLTHPDPKRETKRKRERRAPLQRTFLKTLREIEEQVAFDSPQGVERARWRKLQELDLQNLGGKLVVGMEFCPLYQDGTGIESSKLIKNPTTEDDILNSRVGNKWIAAKAAIEALHQVARSFGLILSVELVFADIGVFVTTEEEKDSQSVERHKQLCGATMQEFCDQLGCNFTLRELSTIEPISKKRVVKPFIVTGQNNFLNPNASTSSFTNHLSITKRELARDESLEKKLPALRRLLRVCNGNIDSFRGLVNTYINYDTATQCDVHIGLERIDELLSIASFMPESSLRTKPSLNILVK